MAVGAQELAVRPLFDDAAGVEHDEAVHLRDGREPVRDGDHRLAAHQRAEALLDRGLDLAVERRGRLVEHEDRRVLQDHAGNRDALPLAAGQLDAALADMSVVAAAAELVLELEDEVVRMRQARRLDDLRVGRAGAAVADIVADRTVQKRGVLRHHRDLRAQRILRDAGNVLAVDEDAAALEIEEAQEQVNQRRLASAGSSDEADLLAGPHRKAQVVNQPVLAPIAEAHILEAHLAARHRHGLGMRTVGQAERPGDGQHALLHDADVLVDAGDLPGDRARRADDLHGHRQRHGDRTDGDVARHPEADRGRAGAEDQHGVEHGQRDRKQGVESHLVLEASRMHVDRLAHIGVLVAGPCEELHREDVGIGVDDAAGQHRARLRRGHRAIAHAWHEQRQRRDVADQPDRRRHGQPAVGGREHDERAGAVNRDGPHRGEELHQGFADRRPGLHHPVGDAAGEIVLEEAPGLPHHVPMVLPPDAVRHVHRDRLVDHELLHDEGDGLHHQEQRQHGGEHRPAFGDELLAGRVGDQRHQFADEDRHCDVEQCDHEARREQRHEHALGLADKVPIEGDEAGRRFGRGRHGGGLHPSFEQPEHALYPTRPRAKPGGSRAREV